MRRMKLKNMVIFILMLTLSISCEKIFDQKSNGEDSPANEDPGDYTWDNSKVVNITLNGTTIAIDSAGATADGSKLTISSAGTYSIKGSLANGQLIVDTKDDGIVRIILSGVNINCSSSAPVFISKANKVVLILADGTRNYLTDGSSYITDKDGEPKAAIFSNSYLSIAGEGALNINASYKDGISSDDQLIIRSGTISVTSKDDGIRGKDYLLIWNGKITVNSGGDGMKSTNDEDADLGYILIEYGTINITAAGGDAIDARTTLLIKDGIFNIKTGGGAVISTGSTGTGGPAPQGPGGGAQPTGGGYNGTVSEKALKAGGTLTIEKGTFTVDAADDAIHSNTDVIIKDGTFELASGDDGIHADNSVTFDGGSINITKSYEGIESASINVNSANIYLASADDGFNATKGKATESNDGSCLTIRSGNIVVNSSQGDGLDSNGNVVISGGTIIVHGPQSSPEVGFDVNGSFDISGGFLIGTGPNSGNMIETPGSTSSQYCIKVTISAALSSSSLLHIEDAAGKDILTFQPVRSIYYAILSSADLKNGSAYNIYTGGASTGTKSNGLYSGGSYTGGTLKKSFTISSKITSVSF
jgi:hypothetical protein